MLALSLSVQANVFIAHFDQFTPHFSDKNRSDQSKIYTGMTEQAWWG